MVANPKTYVDISDVSSVLIAGNAVANGLTAFAGGGQGSAVLLSANRSRVTTVATAGDSVKLPPALVGASLTVFNKAAANAMNVFPSTGDAINALAVNTAFSMAAGKGGIFECMVAGVWDLILSA